MNDNVDITSEYFDFTIEDVIVKKIQTAIYEAVKEGWGSVYSVYKRGVYLKNEATLKSLVEELKSKGFNVVVIERDDDDVKIEISGW